MGLNVIGLISGGKDSLFSLAHCIQNGHKVVALANLHPNYTRRPDENHKDGEGPDLDSFMFQTVGHSIVPLYADALDIPLYRKAITGTAIQDGRYYGWSSVANSGDEIEDMFSLIQEILRSHPNANALNSGAILSTYQRTRVESVAIRLGLVPLAYLWQYPFLPPPRSRNESLSGLLDDMQSSGCDARIIKIASGGIRSKMSFSNIAHPSSRAELILALYPFFSGTGQESWFRGAILGEGGEYETLALNGPGFLWKKKIQVDTAETFEAEGGTIYVRLGKGYLVEQDVGHAVDLPSLPLLDKRFTTIQAEALAFNISADATTDPTIDSTITNRTNVKSNFIKSLDAFQIHNLTSAGSTAAKQFDAIVTDLPFIIRTVAHDHSLPEACLEFGNIVSVMMLLNSMEDFASVNHVYITKLWPHGLPNPPARATLAASLPGEARVSLSLIFDIRMNGTQTRRGLHVQSQSYWAPANIGPYSQAISVPVSIPGVTDHNRGVPFEVVHLAGQIPLIPSKMSMLHGTFVEQAVLALQHLWRVAQERDCDAWAGAGVAFLAGNSGQGEQHISTILQRARTAARIWFLSHRFDEKGSIISAQYESNTEESSTVDDVDDDEDIDVWELQQRNRGFGSTLPKMTVGEHLHKLPHPAIVVEDQKEDDTTEKSPLAIPPFVAAEVIGLPRNAPIEWWSTGIAGLVSMAGVQAHEVLSIPAVLHNSWSLSGFAIRDGDSNASSTTRETTVEDSAQSHITTEKRALSFFVTLTISSSGAINEADSLPRRLSDLQPYLEQRLKSIKPTRYELVTAHSFLNLGSPQINSIREDSQILQNSCVVLCNRVWCVQSYREVSLTDARQCKSIPETQEQGNSFRKELAAEHLVKYHSDVHEAAAVVVMRIETFSD